MVCTDPNLPDELNHFYGRFDRDNSTQPVFSITGVAEPAFVITEQEVKKEFNRLKENKAPGPDGISPRLLKSCASQLAGVFTEIYNKSLQQRKVPNILKKATIIPVPKKNAISGLNDYRPVALTAVPMKTLERIILKFIKWLFPPAFDQHQLHTELIVQ